MDRGSGVIRGLAEPAAQQLDQRSGAGEFVLQAHDTHGEANLRITMMHHPLADLMEFDESNTSDYLKQNTDILLRGHLHKAEVVERMTNTGRTEAGCGGFAGAQQQQLWRLEIAHVVSLPPAASTM